MGDHKNLLLDDIAQQVTYPCLQSYSGCTVSNKLVEILKHERVCPFRPCQCPFTEFECHWEGEPKQLLMHIKSKHPELRGSQAKQTNMVVTHTDIISPQTWLYILYCYKSYFLIKVYVRKEGTRSQLDVVVQLIDWEKYCPKFKFVMTVKSACKSFNQDVPVAGIQIPAQRIREEGMGIMLNDKYIIHYSVNESLQLFIKIKENV